MNFLDLPDLFRDRVVAFCDAQTIVNLRSRSETGNPTGSWNQRFEPVLKVDHVTIFTIIFQRKLSGQEFLKKNSVEIGRKGLMTSSHITSTTMEKQTGVKRSKSPNWDDDSNQRPITTVGPLIQEQGRREGSSVYQSHYLRRVSIFQFLHFQKMLKFIRILSISYLNIIFHTTTIPRLPTTYPPTQNVTEFYQSMWKVEKLTDVIHVEFIVWLMKMRHKTKFIFKVRLDQYFEPFLDWLKFRSRTYKKSENLQRTNGTIGE